MADDSYFVKSFEEDVENVVMGLVDYSSSSDDDYHAPSQKRNRHNDSGSGSDTSLHSNASDDENIMCATRGDKQCLTDSGLNSPLRGSSNAAPEEENDYSDSDDDDAYCETDSDVLKLRPVNWRAVDKWNLPEVYAVVVDRRELRERSQCLKFLDEIGCYNRFRGLSIEMDQTFYADLNKDEAAMLEALEGIHHVEQYSPMLSYHLVVL